MKEIVSRGGIKIVAVKSSAKSEQMIKLFEDAAKKVKSDDEKRREIRNRGREKS